MRWLCCLCMLAVVLVHAWRACCCVLTTAAVLHPLLLLLSSQLEFPDPRTYFVTGTKGFFGGLVPSLACPNQWSNNNTSPVTSIDLPFTVGCNVKGALSCTSSAGTVRALVAQLPCVLQEAAADASCNARSCRLLPWHAPW